MTSYYVSVNGQSYGPATADELRQWSLAGSFSPSDFVWLADRNEWASAASVPELAVVFTAAAAPGAGVEDVEELPAAERAQVPEAEKEKESFCANHELSPAAFVCPRCRQSYCDACRIIVDGQAICENCVSEEKGQAAGPRKRNLIFAGAGLLIAGAMVGAYAVFGPRPVEQAPTPPKVDLNRGDTAPAFATESLKPAERAKVEADMRFLVAARKVALADTAATDTASMAGEGWVQYLFDYGYLDTHVQPPREGLVYRPAPVPPGVDLWTTGDGARAFLHVDEETAALIPRP